MGAHCVVGAHGAVNWMVPTVLLGAHSALGAHG
jgi:hypothetical protein